MWDKQPAVTQLLFEQQEHLIELLKQVGWQKTGKNVFEAFFSILPMVPMELALVPEFLADEEPCVHMWHRKDDWYEGSHMDGGYILRGETDRQAIERVLQKEADLQLLGFEFIRDFNTRPESGHVPNHQLSRFYYCSVRGKPKMGDFYPLTKLPKDTLGHHRRYVDHLRAFFLRRKTMREVGIWHDGEHFASEGKWLCARFYGLDDREEKHEYDTLDEAVQSKRRLDDERGLERSLFHVYNDLGWQIV